MLGGESVLPYAATAPLPPGVEELLFAGFLNGRGIELVPCKTIPLEVPANAEIVIEGFVDPALKLMEGPFGDHTGFYSMADCFPALHVTAITTRKNRGLSRRRSSASRRWRITFWARPPSAFFCRC